MRAASCKHFGTELQTLKALAGIHRALFAQRHETAVHFCGHRPGHAARGFILWPEAIAMGFVGKPVDNRQAVPDYTFAIPQNRDLAARWRKILAGSHMSSQSSP